MLQSKLSKYTCGINAFLAEWLSKRQGFECRSFYGETFTLALLSRAGILNETIKHKLLSTYESIDKNDSQFHWEFNNYALLDYYHNSHDTTVETYLKPLRFKNTPCTNWTLLRSNSRLKAGVDTDIAISEAKEKIEKFQLPSGLILDDPGVKSFQYHCFSMAMIAEIYEQTGDCYFYDSFIHGVEFIRHFILSNGEALYVGRGQNQSFGYGTLIYILALAYRHTLDKTILGDIDLVLGFLGTFQRDDGSFPLVLSNSEKGIPQIVDMREPQFSGWYPYNNYFDYLPFMGFFLAKASVILTDVNISEACYKARESYRDDDFIKIVTASYEAVLSRPGGYWSNDLPIPYVVTAGKNVTPCYGGEQFQNSLYDIKGIPLPYCESLQKSIRWRSVSWFQGNRLWLVSPLGIMRRNFYFDSRSITIKTRVFSLFRFKHIYFRLDQPVILFDGADHVSFDGYSYSASGKLSRFVDHANGSVMVIGLAQ